MWLIANSMMRARIEDSRAPVRQYPAQLVGRDLGSLLVGLGEGGLQDVGRGLSLSGSYEGSRGKNRKRADYHESR